MFWDDPCTRLWVGVGVEEGGSRLDGSLLGGCPNRCRCEDSSNVLLVAGIPVVAVCGLPRRTCDVPCVPQPWTAYRALCATFAVLGGARHAHNRDGLRPSHPRVFVHFTLSLSYSTSLTLLLSLSFSLSYCLSTFPFMAVEPGKATLGRGVP